MEYFYPLLLYVGLGGGLLLLGVASLPWLHALHKPITVICLSLLTSLWLFLPAQGRWVLSVWSPGSILGGQILLDLTLPLWWCGLVIGIVFTGATCVELAERRDTFPLLGPLLVGALLIMWTSLVSGSLLAMLAVWGVFDLVWAAAGLMSGVEGERITFSLAVHGVSSIVLWMVALILLREGESGLWWLMWPSNPMLTLLLVAALMRMGFYPFQIVIPGRMESMRPLTLLYALGPITGISLLYRLMTLPGVRHLPDWIVIWGVLSLFWNALMAWSARQRDIPMRIGHALWLGVISGACVLHQPSLLLLGTAAWIACQALLAYGRGGGRDGLGWAWFAWLALLFLMGIFPSPLGTLFQSLFVHLPWGWKIFFLLGGMLTLAALLRGILPRFQAAVTPPWVWQRLGLLLGLLLMLLALLSVSLATSIGSFSWLGLGFWIFMVLGAVGLARWGKWLRIRFRKIYPFLDFLDLQWFYRSMWRGADHLLGVLRVSAEVVEGSGAVVWSLLILLLTLLVVASR